jgi:hypothetical protein
MEFKAQPPIEKENAENSSSREAYLTSAPRQSSSEWTRSKLAVARTICNRAGSEQFLFFQQKTQGVLPVHQVSGAAVPVLRLADNDESDAVIPGSETPLYFDFLTFLILCLFFFSFRFLGEVFC